VKFIAKESNRVGSSGRSECCTGPVGVRERPLVRGREGTNPSPLVQAVLGELKRGICTPCAEVDIGKTVVIDNNPAGPAGHRRRSRRRAGRAVDADINHTSGRARGKGGTVRAQPEEKEIGPGRWDRNGTRI
jgi:hypothetical protein